MKERTVASDRMASRIVVLLIAAASMAIPARASR